MFLKKCFYFIYKFLISLKLAVITLSLLAVLTAIGTFVESKYDQDIANTLVYHSPWMISTLVLLSINLIMVLIDRWPWKLRQIPFLLAHTGILTLMMGFYFSKNFGISGSLQFKEGEAVNFISLPDMEIKLYASYNAEKFTLLYEKPVNMVTIKPTKKKPFIVKADGEEFQVNQFFPFAMGQELFKSQPKGGSPALRFHLSGSRANMVEWLSLDLGEKTKTQNYGPAQITLTLDSRYKTKNKKELVLLVKDEALFFSLGTAQPKLLKKGELFSTGWMDFKFRLLEFFPKAQKEFIFTPRKQASDQTVRAIHVFHKGESVWLGQNSYVRFFKKDKLYVLAYLNKTQPLGFNLKLLDFKIDKYQGSEKAKNYASKVKVSGLNDFLISMNEPLKHEGFTFYQSSFVAPKKKGEAYLSILSVNRDPGRFLKYAGSFLTVLGVILLFIRRWLRKTLNL